MKIHQMVPALHDGDAIGDSARAMRDYFRSHNYEADIFAYDIDESLTDEAVSFQKRTPEMGEKDLLILHYALPSGMTDFLKRSFCKKSIIYHNITPSYYWMNYDPSLLHLASAGRRELESLAPFADRSAGDSEYNRQELEKLSFRNTCVIPIYVKQERYTGVSPQILKTIQDGLFNILFVGRVAPNKKLEDVLSIFAVYKRMFNPLSRVIFVGKTNVALPYYAALNDIRARLGLMPEDVLYAGHVDWSELVAYYKGSHVFLSMSEHEGFCVPLVEAMICGTPIVAYSTTAIPYTLGDAGVQVKEKNFPEIAGICRRVETDAAFRESVLESQQKQLKNYSKEELEKAIDAFLEPLV